MERSTSEFTFRKTALSAMARHLVRTLYLVSGMQDVSELIACAK